MGENANTWKKLKEITQDFSYASYFLLAVPMFAILSLLQNERIRYFFFYMFRKDLVYIVTCITSLFLRASRKESQGMKYRKSWRSFVCCSFTIGFFLLFTFLFCLLHFFYSFGKYACIHVLEVFLLLLCSRTVRNLRRKSARNNKKLNLLVFGKEDKGILKLPFILVQLDRNWSFKITI